MYNTLLFYYNNKFNLIKLQTNDKKPIGSWGKVENLDKEQYINTYSKHKGNLGINCGLSMLIVIDSDEKNGKHGRKMLQKHLSPEHFKELENTYTIRTPSGGLHYYFKTDKIINTNHSKWLDGVDIQCKGAYVVAPPSIINGCRYEIINNTDIKQIPEWLLEQLVHFDTVTEYATPSRETVNKHLKRLTEAQPGNRDDRLNTFAYILNRYIKDSISTSDEKLFLLETFSALVQDIPAFQEWDDYKKISKVFYNMQHTVQKLPLTSIEDKDLAAHIELQLDNRICRIREFSPRNPYMMYKDGIWIHDLQAEDKIYMEYNKAFPILSNKIHDKEEQLSRETEKDKKQQLTQQIYTLKKNLRIIKAHSKMIQVVKMLGTSHTFRKSIEQFDTNSSILTFKNGVYNFDTRKLEEHNLNNFSTKKINLDYSTTINGGCKFMQFIIQIMPDKKEREFLLLCLGYGFTSINHWKKFFIFQGESDTGKSTLINVIVNLLNYGNNKNNYTCSVDTETFNKYNNNSSREYHIANLKGKTMSFLMEPPRGYNLNESFIKMITGDDLISGRSICKDPISFKSSTKLFMISNYDINISETDDSIWNRVILFKFRNKIQTIDKKWLQKLTEQDYTEALSILLQYAQRAYDLEDVEQIIPKSIKENVIEYRASQDWVKEILDTYFEITDNKHYRLSSSTMLQIFNIARTELGYKGNIGSKVLKKVLEEKEITFKRMNSRRYYLGLKVLDKEFFIWKGINNKELSNFIQGL